MRLVFIGASQFGLSCLQLTSDFPGVSIVGVVTAPRVFPISYRPMGVTNVLHADVSSYADDKKIPLITLKNGMSDPVLFSSVCAWEPDAFLVVGWYHMIPKSWRKIAPAYGMHASLLPNYSGGAPLVWAIINGEEKTGITLFQMGDGVDNGPIVAQLEEPIRDCDTISTLYSRIEARGLELLKNALPQLCSGTVNLCAQDESKRRAMPQRSPEDGLVDWSKSSAYIDRFVRAQTRPYPGAFTNLNGERLSVWSGVPLKINLEGVLGQVLKCGTKYIVICGKGDGFEIGEISYQGRVYRPECLAQLFGLGGQVLR